MCRPVSSSEVDCRWTSFDQNPEISVYTVRDVRLVKTLQKTRSVLGELHVLYCSLE